MSQSARLAKFSDAAVRQVRSLALTCGIEIYANDRGIVFVSAFRGKARDGRPVNGGMWGGDDIALIRACQEILPSLGAQIAGREMIAEPAIVIPDSAASAELRAAISPVPKDEP